MPTGEGLAALGAVRGPPQEPTGATREQCEQLDRFRAQLAKLRRGGDAAPDAECTAAAAAGGGEGAAEDPDRALAEFRERERREFHLKEYWEARYEGRPDHNEDWLCVWSDVSELLLARPQEDWDGWVRPEDKVLTLGCGNSTMPGEMFLDGIRNQVATDYSEKVMQQMRESYPEEFLHFACSRDQEIGVKPHQPGEQIDWREADATALTSGRGGPFAPGSFDVVAQKTLLDTLLCSPKRDVLIDALWTEVWDVLAPDGRFISLDLHPQDAVIGWLHDWSRRHKLSWKIYPLPYDVLSRIPAGMRNKVRHACFVAQKDGTLP